MLGRRDPDDYGETRVVFQLLMQIGNGKDHGMSRLKAVIIAAALPSMPVAALQAQAPQTAVPDTLSLSDAQKAEVLSHDTEESVDMARAGLGGSASPDRKIHGEVGAMIGSRGARGVYGVAAMPLGENSQATVSFENSRSDLRR